MYPILASIIIWFLGYYPRPDSKTTSPGENMDATATAKIANATTIVAETTSAETETETETETAAELAPTEFASEENSFTASYLEQIGRFCEPVLEPLGLNWKAGVALISGAAAKEIIVSTLGVLYADNGATSSNSSNTNANIAETSISPSENDLVSVENNDNSEAENNNNSEAENNAALSKTDSNIGISEEEVLLKTQLLKSGDFTPASAISFMIFALLYFPCIATLAAIATEAGSWKWALFSFLYSCTAAWIISFVIYNICKLFS